MIYLLWLVDLTCSVFWAAVCLIYGPPRCKLPGETVGELAVSYVHTRKDLLQVFLGRYQAFQVTYAKFPRFGLDANRHDLLAFHLVCRREDKLVGYYRVNVADFAFRSTFHLLSADRVMEASRAYIPREARGQQSSQILSLLWRSVADLGNSLGIRYIVGRGSIKCNAQQITALCRDYANNRKDILNAVPKYPCEKVDSEGVATPNMPSLLRRYFSLGIKFSGEPGWNPHLKLYDIFIVCDLRDPENFFYRG